LAIEFVNVARKCCSINFIKYSEEYTRSRALSYIYHRTLKNFEVANYI